MSRKWQRTRQWDAEHLTGALAPVRWVLHTLSSVWLAVALLVVVALYGTVASVPIGLIALIPTWLVVVLSAATSAAIGALAIGTVARSMAAKAGTGWRFAATLIGGLIGAAGLVWAWSVFAWPAMHYDPATGEGLRFFADFAERYDSVTLRRLPGFEMTELEFYSWWPLRVVLILFVVNLFVATVRRIDFTFRNLGVLTVHTGIIVIALGSVYYQSLKTEGDTILLAANTAPGMSPHGGGVAEAPSTDAVPGPPQRWYYDATRVVLFVSQEGKRNRFGQAVLEQRPLVGLPRYNDYGLDGVPRGDESGAMYLSDALRGNAADAPDGSLPALDIDVAPRPNSPMDPDIRLRVVGYASYARLSDDTRLYAEEDIDRADLSRRLDPVEVIELFFTPPGEERDPDSGPVNRFLLRPNTPAARVSENNDLAIEMTNGMAEERWTDLTTRLPAPVPAAMVVEVPTEGGGEAERFVLPARTGARHTLGETGWSIGVRSIEPQPPFPIITEGYEGATSSVLIVRLTPPDGEAFDRWVYHRFPEITQDFLDNPVRGGQPRRRDADPRIRVGFLDQSKFQFYIDRTSNGRYRAVARGIGEPKVFDDIETGEKLVDVVERLDFKIVPGWPDSETVQRPVPTPDTDRDAAAIGTHGHALVGVEVTVDGLDDYREVVWLPFTKYLNIGDDASRTVPLPDGRELSLMFGRYQLPFPDFSIRLVDFEMIAYDHRGAPRDYQSTVLVDRPTLAPEHDGFEPYERVVKLNAPLRAPYTWRDDEPLFSNVVTYVTRGLNPRQFKISQSGWDQQGWNQTQQLVDQGVLEKPVARFTIMHVGNNPGIHIIALGGVLMAVGTPWAFYVKPWLVRREKRRLAERHGGGRAERSSPDAVPAT